LPEKSARATKAAPKATKAAPKATKAPAKKTAGKRSTPDHAEIAERAYFIYLEEGAQDAASNWLRAERELTVG
jgi:hypothetical protein